jgi:glycosyltransferase involved in cell wall biosynthesis
MPQLSIGIPVFNGEKFLPGLLDCLLAQTFEDFEILICDNASTDLTPQICRDYEQHDSRIRFVRNQRNIGAVANFNRVFELSTAPLFKWAAHDDLHHEAYLDTCMRLLNKSPDTVLAHTHTAFIDEEGEILPFEHETGSFIDPKSGKRYWADLPDIGDNPIAINRFWQVLTRALWGTHMFGVIRRETLQQTSLLPNFAGSDRAMLAELALLGRFRCAEERLFLRRLHANGSATLNHKEIRSFLSTDGKHYSRRLRQIRAYFRAPGGKPISPTSKLACLMMVSAHCAKTTLHSVRHSDPRRAVHGYGWQ